MKIELNIDHLVERTKERYSILKGDKNIKEHFLNLKGLLINSAPSDWRFTVDPTAKFLIFDFWFQHTSLPTNFYIIILGRTYRDTGKDLLQKIRNKTFKNLNECQEEYLKIISNPNVEIVQELKTVYKKGEDISEVKNLNYSIYESIYKEILPLHIIPLNAKRIASRPNAIIDKDGKVWVRQGEYVSLNQDNKSEYLLFERLTKDGVDKSVLRFYEFKENGSFKLYKESRRDGLKTSAFTNNASKGGFSENFRTQSYWQLPTYVDAYFTDLKYKFDRLSEKKGDEGGPISPNDAYVYINLWLIKESCWKKLKEKEKK